MNEADMHEIDAALEASQANRDEDTGTGDLFPEGEGGPVPEPNRDDPKSAELAPKPNAEPSKIRVSRGRLLPADHSELMRVAGAMHAANVKISGVNTPADMFVALMAGSAIGLDAATTLRSVYVIDGKAAIYGDALPGVAQQSGFYAGHGITITGDPDDGTLEAACVVRRIVPTADGKFREVEYVGAMSWRQAERAGLTGRQNWRKYPERMLRAKAVAYAFREAFADVLCGFAMQADEEEILEGGRAPFDPSRVKGRPAPEGGSADAILEAAAGSEVGGTVDVEA